MNNVIKMPRRFALYPWVRNYCGIPIDSPMTDERARAEFRLQFNKDEPADESMFENMADSDRNSLFYFMFKGDSI